MRLILLYLGFFLFLSPLQPLLAQEADPVPMIQFYPGYTFKDGLFLNISDVKNNDPIPLSRVVTDLNAYNEDFFDEMRHREEIIIYDENGVQGFIKTKNIWGYALDGHLYIMLGGRFQRFILEGSISHFIASETTHEKRYLGPTDTVSNYTTTQDLYRSFHKKHYYATVSSEGRISLYDFETNILTDYHPEILGLLLERDSILFSEYDSLRKREQKKRMGEYIRRYNRNHPLYFPDIN